MSWSLLDHLLLMILVQVPVPPALAGGNDAFFCCRLFSELDQPCMCFWGWEATIALKHNLSPWLGEHCCSWTAPSKLNLSPACKADVAVQETSLGPAGEP